VAAKVSRCPDRSGYDRLQGTKGPTQGILRHRLRTLVKHQPIDVCYILLKVESTQMQLAVGFKIQGKTGHVVVDAEDALIAALKVKVQRPEALIAYVRQQNKRGDTRHPMRRLGSENR
jgi:hypothetical protein